MNKVLHITTIATTYNAGGETLAAWVEGQKISDTVEYARYFRALVKEAEGIDLPQTDERIFEVGEKSKSDAESEGEGIDEDDIVAALIEDSKASLGKADYSKSDGTAVPSETLVTLKSSAAVIASKLDAVSDMMDSLAKKDEELKIGPRDILFALRAALGDQGMMALPIPGTTNKETDHYDRYKYTAKNVATGKNMTVQGSVIKDIELSMKGGAELETLKKAYEAANSKKPDAPAHIAKMSASERMTTLKSLSNRQQYRRKALAASIKLWHQYVDVNAIAPDRIKLSFIMQRDTEGKETDKLVTSAACLVLRDTKMEHEPEWLTIPQLMSYKPSWCTPENIKAEGGPWQALAVSASRSAPEDTAAGIKTNEALLEALTMAKVRLGDKANTAEFNKSVLDKKNTAMHMIIGDLYLDLKALWEQGLSSLYSKAAAAEAEVEADRVKAAAAKLATQHNATVGSNKQAAA